MALKNRAEDEVIYFKAALDKSQDTAQKITLLLDDKNKNKESTIEWEKAIKALEFRISNQEKTEKEKASREEKILRQNRILKRALDAEKAKIEKERNKSFFQKLFGG